MVNVLVDLAGNVGFFIMSHIVTIVVTAQENKIKKNNMQKTPIKL
jgi:hypothetical protein